jgi:hypothetical protein
MDNGFMFFDSDTQARVVSALTKEGVPFEIRSDGYVIYRSQDEARVSRIRLAVLNESYTPNAHFFDQHREELFLARLKSEGIPFDVHVKKGDRWISWSERDDKRAEEIYRSVINPP